MNVIEIWKAEVAKRNHYSQYDKEEFVKILNTQCPDWREQIRDKRIWKDLHTYGSNVNETLYLDVFLEELGLEYAYFMTNCQKGILDAVSALNYCCEFIGTDWKDFPLDVKERILEHHLPAFLNESKQNAGLWNSLTDLQKKSVLDEAILMESKYVSDLIVYLIWKNELKCKNTPYLVFQTSRFKHTVEEIRRINERRNDDTDENRRRHDEDFLEREFDFHLRSFDIPKIDSERVPAVMAAQGLGRLSYTPSDKISLLRDAAEVANDSASVKVIDKALGDIRSEVESH